MEDSRSRSENEVLSSGVTGFDKKIDIRVVLSKAAVAFKSTAKIQVQKTLAGFYPRFSRLTLLPKRPSEELILD